MSGPLNGPLDQMGEWMSSGRLSLYLSCAASTAALAPSRSVALLETFGLGGVDLGVVGLDDGEHDARAEAVEAVGLRWHDHARREHIERPRRAAVEARGGRGGRSSARRRGRRVRARVRKSVRRSRGRGAGEPADPGRGEGTPRSARTRA